MLFKRLNHNLKFGELICFNKYLKHTFVMLLIYKEQTYNDNYYSEWLVQN